MKNEKKNSHALREKMSRFNNWERTYIKNLSRDERFRQFAELFELGMSSDKATIENAHREHLEQLSRLARTKR